MLISEAKHLVGQMVNLTYSDRNGQEFTEATEVYDVAFVPLYGPCVICDLGEIRLDRVLNSEIIAYQQLRAA
ncbi:hypothetical protein QPK87_07140 [Kamptonema cortianum]|nr:hypothetical protein [Geitlerinema splendidum]MDK3156349.1 hypothetical protein [Kamptonema cortianum]